MRIPRFEIIYDDCFVHIVWKTHNDEFLLNRDSVKQILYDLLLKYKSIYLIKIFAYCFLSNHVHIVCHMQDMIKFSRYLQIVHSKFARAYNTRMDRSGQVIKDRAKTPVIENEEYLITAMFYADTNPVKAKMIPHPKDYKWSSYNHYAYGKADPLIDDSPTYLELSDTPKERQRIYREMVEDYMLKNKIHSNFVKIVKDLENESCYFGNPEWVINKYKELKLKLDKRASNNPRDGTFPPPWNKNLPPL